ncbi:TetR/AcrR family transcriptional regulator [Desulforhopalus singaporensis]|uniref:Transcriptional regulator, TetR family n=1 Tax=Desulforhopalus singaporensis TaxID=91360 RepID=A0A1H0V6V5_9BACT|nr:TetR/AcrR family transcriptional regulator [Desulforhopalus singaporensis]SDP74137.1 transcriptional regulator, TetR family [Desulforhopalus singaporensis]
MPKQPRSAEEIEEVKQQILEETLALITEHGYEGFSMRKLALRLHIAAKTIYNYYDNKDEIYLLVLKRGFDLLHSTLLKSMSGHSDPIDKLRAMKNAYIDFGVNQSNYYDIMFTLYVPKHNDFVGTPLEHVATVELKAALRVGALFTDVMKEIAEIHNTIPKEEARRYFIQFWTSLHGLVTTYNNDLLGYLSGNPFEDLLIISNRLLRTFTPRPVEPLPDI